MWEKYHPFCPSQAILFTHLLESKNIAKKEKDVFRSGDEY